MKTLLLLVLITATAALGQAPAPAPTGTPTDPANPQTNLALLRCKLPGGTYSVAVRAIIAVSTHEYLVDGAVRVTEVNIDTAGSLVARFYHLEPATPTGPVPLTKTLQDRAQELLNQGSEKVGLDTWKKVVKNYPTTTHARTVEYRLDTKEQLTKIFEAADEALRLQRGKNLKIE
ncbi:MAG TPA: hypothetical protein VF614_08275 [Chthoniobacteraceae bacterium]|jgi:hypothetical protein